MTATDTGSQIQVAFSGRTIAAGTGAMTETLAVNFNHYLPAPQVPLPPKFEDIRITAEGAFTFRFEGGPAASYMVFVSEDLGEWTEIGVPEETSPGVFRFTDAEREAFPSRFYRVGAGN